MEKRLLITVSDEVSCLYGIRFVNSFFRNKSAIRITLFYIEPRWNNSVVNRNFGQQSVIDMKDADSGQKKGRDALTRAQELLVSGGFSPEAITSQLLFKQLGTAKDIVREGSVGLYDGVVLGRRGYGLLETLFTPSVSKEILDQNIDFPLWISRCPEMDRRNVLLCVDDSESSLRMADHVGFMLQDEEHVVTIFHVDTGQEEGIPLMMERARRKLLENGISRERIDTLVVRSHKVVKTILDEAERKTCAVVAVGRMNKPRDTLKDWLFGSKCMSLLESLEKATLWVSK